MVVSLQHLAISDSIGNSETNIREVTPLWHGNLSWKGGTVRPVKPLREHVYPVSSSYFWGRIATIGLDGSWFVLSKALLGH